MENIRQKIAEIIAYTHKTPLEQADEILLLFGVSRQSEQLQPDEEPHIINSATAQKPVLAVRCFSHEELQAIKMDCAHILKCVDLSKEYRDLRYSVIVKIDQELQASKKYGYEGGTHNDGNAELAEDFFYLDLADWGYWLIKSRDGKRYTAGYDKQKVQDLIKRLNEAHRPNIHQGEMHEIYVCWNDHDKIDKCRFEQEL